MDSEKISFAERLMMGKNYDKVLEDIKKYNRKDTVNMSELEMNKFRHIAGPAYLTSKYYSPGITNALGIGKEAKDLLKKRGLEDTLYDYGNNQIGIEIGLGDRQVKGTQKDLFDHIFRTHILPFRDTK